MGNPSSKTIVWFRRDLRIEDNPALAAAARVGHVLPVFIWCPKEEGQFLPGRVSRWWLKQSLVHLDHSLRSLGASLVLIKAESTLAALLRLLSAVGANRVAYNHLYDPVSLVRDHNIKKQLVELGINVQSFNGDLLYEPWDVYDEKGHAFTTFNAYWDKCMSMPMEPVSLLPPRRLVPLPGTVESCSVDDLGLEDELEKSSNALLSRAWSPGWSNADNMLTKFVTHQLCDYLRNRCKVEGARTSLLSPHLHFGELSIRKVFQSIRNKQILWKREGNIAGEKSVDFFMRAVGLREYSRYLCFNFPFMQEKSLLSSLRHFPWRPNLDYFKAWRQGRTGYPLVDAGMRELWATGWIHNRIRVIVSSFCVKFLLLPWTWGMKYFWDTLLDADLESDILGWQYISGSLPDGHELDRLDCPEVQGCNFDPDGEYVRQWLPELARMPTDWIHHPWDAPIPVLRAAGVDLGLNYPKPIVEIDSARECLVSALSEMWERDAAARAGKIDGTSEVVAENSNVPESLPHPSAVIEKRVCSSSSAYDQRVPTICNSKVGSHEQEKVKDSDGDRPNRCNFENHSYEGENARIEENLALKKARTEEDLNSTAESSSVRKRSFRASPSG